MERSAALSINSKAAAPVDFNPMIALQAMSGVSKYKIDVDLKARSGNVSSIASEINARLPSAPIKTCERISSGCW